MFSRRLSQWVGIVVVSFLSLLSISVTQAETPYNGATQGSFTVNALGSATYSIPIEVPPGINGLQPELSLNYDSQGGNGLLGVGWSLGGLSSITRCPKTIAQDGEIRGVKLDNQDRFCLDGQRLIVTNGMTYGASGAEYRTEVDSFQKVTSNGSCYNNTGPCSFVVETPDRKIIQYGTSDDSKHTSIIPLTLEEFVISWSVSEIKDQSENLLRYSYFSDAYSGEHRIDNISYFINKLTGKVELNIKFNYPPNDRGDLIERYIAGVKLSTKKFLSSISVNNSLKSFRNYNITYNVSSNTNVLQMDKLTVCDENQNCKIPNNYSWINAGVNSFQDRSKWVDDYGSGNGYDPNHHPRMTGDVDGDGVEDIVAIPSDGVYVSLSTGAGFLPRKRWIADYGSNHGYIVDVHPRFLADVNGDGLQDLVAIPSDGVYVSLSNGSSFLPRKRWIEGYGSNAGYNPEYHLRMLVDVDGDGLSDIVGIPSDGVYVSLSTGSSFLPRKRWIADYGSGAGYSPSHHPRMLADVNGDGLPDMVGIPSDGVYVSISTGKYFMPREKWVNGYGTNAGYLVGIHPRFLADVNGDGLQDLVAIPSDGVYVSLSTGTRFLPRKRWLADYGSGAGYSPAYHPRMLRDVNGDGLQDVIAIPSDGVYVSLSTGENFKPRVKWISDYGTNAGYTVNVHPRMLADVSGDGLPDLVAIPSDGVYVSKNNMLLEKIERFSNSQNGKYTAVQYKPITDDAIYTKDANSPNCHPVCNIQAPIYVVSSVEADNGIGGTNTTNYHYEDAKVHSLGRGFQGFAKITKTTTNASTSITNQIITDYWQMPGTDYVRSGAVRSVEHKVNGVTMSTAVDIPEIRLSDAGRPFSYTTRSTMAQFDYGTGQKVKEVEMITVASDVDAFGNVSRTDTLTCKPECPGPSKTSSEVYTSSKLITYDPSDFWKGLVTEEISRRSDGSFGSMITVSKKKFTYHPGTSKVHTQSVHNIDTDAVENTSTYLYNPTYGYRDNVTITARGVAKPRISSTQINFPTSPSSKYQVVKTKVLALDDQGNITKTAVETSEVDMATGKTINFIGANKILGPDGYTTEWIYDSFGRKIKELRADGNSSEWKYISCIANSLCNTSTGPNEAYYVQSFGLGKPTTTVFYDAYHRKVRTESVGFNNSIIESRTVYDENSRTLGSTNDYFKVGGQVYWTCSEFDAIGRAVRQTIPTTIDCTNLSYIPSLRTNTYDGLHTFQTIHNGNGLQESHSWRNVVDQLTQVTDANGESSTYTYHVSGNLESVTDAGNNVVRTIYDSFGRKKSMHDPDMGIWSYEYNGLSELTKQTDAESQITAMEYDVTGRMVTRVGGGESESWVYDNCYNGSGKLCSTISSNGYQKTLSYDFYGRPTSTQSTILSQTYKVDRSYTQEGKVHITSYPMAFGSRFEVQNCYDSNGYLKEVRSPGQCSDLGGTKYWRANGINANGKISHETLGDNITTARVYENAFGRLKDISSGAGATLQSSHFKYDIAGNLMERRMSSDVGLLQDVVETYTYDLLNRLEYSKTIGPFGSIPIEKTYAYDAIGNITKKSDFADTYIYDNGRPHAVSRVTNGGGQVASYTYDNNGFMNYSNGKIIAPNWFNKTASITGNSVTTTFGYDTAHVRTWKSNAEGTTVYLNPRIDLGAHYEKETKSGVETHKFHIYGGSGVIGVHEATQSTQLTKYFLKDHLGSIEVVVNADGTQNERLSYDAFGKRRNPKGNYDPVIEAMKHHSTHHGFTGHEHMDDYGFINMNARLYDPNLGRFMSADPIVAYATSTQGFNRYSYTDNNPLSRVDLNGNSWLSEKWKGLDRKYKNAIIGFMVGGVSGMTLGYHHNSIKNESKRFFLKHKWARQVGSIVAAYYGPGTSAAFAAYLTQIYGGSESDMWRTAGKAYVTAKVFQKINNHYGKAWDAGRVAVTATAGGAAADWQGGSFKDGFKMSGGIALLTWGALEMRASMIKQSKLDPRNSSGTSAGLNNDGFKLTGNRYDYSEGWFESGGDPFGGRQGGPGRFGFGDFSINYEPGGAIDFAFESFAGPHDFLSDWLVYDSWGNTQSYITGVAANTITYAVSAVNIVVATPFAMSSMVQPYTSGVIQADLRK